MSYQLVEYKKVNLLGRASRCDQLVQWSQKQSIGKRYTRDFAHGLRLVFEADGSCPRIYFHWNQAKFLQFLKLGNVPCEHVFFMEFGVSVMLRQGRTLVTLPGVAGTKAVLWDSNKGFCQLNQEVDTFWLVGMVRITSQGFEFSSHNETQVEQRLAAPVAKLRIGEPLPNLEAPDHAPLTLPETDKAD